MPSNTNPLQGVQAPNFSYEKKEIFVSRHVVLSRRRPCFKPLHSCIGFLLCGLPPQQNCLFADRSRSFLEEAIWQ